MQQEEELQAMTSMKSSFFSFCEVHVVDQNKIISEVAFRAKMQKNQKQS